jgi:Transglycosylase associated protein
LGIHISLRISRPDSLLTSAIDGSTVHDLWKQLTFVPISDPNRYPRPALIGGFLLSFFFNTAGGGWWFTLFTAILGSVILLWVVGLFRKTRA